MEANIYIDEARRMLCLRFKEKTNGKIFGAKPMELVFKEIQKHEMIEDALEIPLSSNILEAMAATLKPTVAAEPNFITLCESEKEILKLKNKGKVERVEAWPEPPKEEELYKYIIEAFNTDSHGSNLVRISFSARNEDEALSKAKKLTSRQHYAVVGINSTP